MGQTPSSTPRARAHRALSDILPPYQQMEYNSNWIREDVGMKVFTSAQEREQFIASNATSKKLRQTPSIDKENAPADNKVPRTHTDALLTVITNTQHSIPLPALASPDSGFRLLYSRHPTASKSTTSEGPLPPPTRVFASLVAMDDSGAIRAKIEPKEGGEEQREAFLRLREYVEVELGVVLRRVGEGEGRAGESESGSGSGSGGGVMGPPPSYGELGGSLEGDRKG